MKLLVKFIINTFSGFWTLIIYFQSFDSLLIPYCAVTGLTNNTFSPEETWITEWERNMIVSFLENVVLHMQRCWSVIVCMQIALIMPLVWDYFLAEEQVQLQASGDICGWYGPPPQNFLQCSCIAVLQS